LRNPVTLKLLQLHLCSLQHCNETLHDAPLLHVALLEICCMTSHSCRLGTVAV